MSGNKADNLNTLVSLGLAVPEFYVIKETVLKQLGTRQTEKKLIADLRHWSQLNNINEVAVRSSTDAEDSMGQSYAGQFTSIMKVSGDRQFIAAVRTVFTSRPKAGYSSQKAYKVHIIVQRYIEPDTAGVLFTVNPSNGLSEMLINVVNGHGEKVVDGKDVNVIHVQRPSGEARSQHKALLTPDQIRALQVLGETIEKHLQSPQDIEWAFTGKTLYVLQTRPVTRIAYTKIWDNANIGESFPGIVLPLTFSVARRGYELVYKSQGLEGGLSWYQLEANHRIFHDMVGLFGGRMYYNLASWYKFIGLFPNNSQNQKYLDDQLQTIGDAAYLPPSHYPVWYKFRFFSRAIRRAILFERERENYWRTLESAFGAYEGLPAGTDLPLLLNRYAFIEQQVVPYMGRSADNDFFVMVFHGLLKKKLEAWFGTTHTTDFLGQLHDLISARQATLLSDIAAYITGDPVANSYLQEAKYADLDAYLVETKAEALLDEYRTTFLHRFAEDQKLEAVNPMLSIDGFYRLIKAYQQLDSKTVASRQVTALAAEQQRSKNVLSRLNPVRKIIYGCLLERLKHHLRIREHNRLLRGKAYAYLRTLFLEVGRSLESQGIINAARDVYYLDIEEIFSLADGTGYDDNVQDTIRARKQRYSEYEKLKLPPRFVTTGLTNKLPQQFTSPTTGSIPQRSLNGTMSSPGDVIGKVIVLDKPVIPNEPFDILVVSHTDPGWTPLIALARGLIIEHGGILSHAAIVTRELGIPSIIGVEDATQRLKDGMLVHINTAKSTVDILDGK